MATNYEKRRMLGDDPVSIEDRSPEEGIDKMDGNPFTPKIDDKDLLKIIKSDWRQYETKFQELDSIRQKNEKYLTGKQVNRRLLKVGDAEIVDNRILISIETMASIITSVTPLPWIIVTPRNKRGRKIQNKLERHLRDEWEYVQNMQQIMERMVRVFFTSRFAMLKARWCDITDDFKFDLVRPENVRFDWDSSTIEDSPYVIERITDTIANLILRFPDKEEYLLGVAGSKGERSKLTITEYWGYYRDGKEMKSYVAWKYKNEILGKELNPFWNEKGKNHFAAPRHPYIAMNSINTGKSIVDDTSLIEQAIPLQDGVNKRKRQIDANAGLSNGVIVGSSQYMTKAEFDKITMTPKEKIWLNGDAEDVNNALRILTGRALDQGVFDDMVHSIREIDNVMGTHETTRGERTGEETATGRSILRDADFGRQDLTARSYEQVAEEVYNWMVQMMYVKYTRKKQIISEREDVDPVADMKVREGLVPLSELNDEIGKDDLKQVKVKVIVKKGSTRPKDPASMQDMALTLMQVGQLDPLTFHEIYSGELPPDPRKTARRLFLWATEPARLFPELSGADLIDPEAIRHIDEMIERGYGAQDELFEEASLDNIPDYQKHVDTHRLYLQGVEVDDDLTPFEELTIDQQEAILEHTKLEQARLQTLIEQERERQALQTGQVSPEQPMGQMMPQQGGQVLAGGAVEPPVQPALPI